MERQRTHDHILVRILVALAVVACCAAGAFLWYVGDYYHADEHALVAMEGDEDVQVEHLESGDVAFVPTDPTCGLVFYPGGKVEAEAYAPLLSRCAESGILCVLVRFPANIAFFDENAADRVREEYDDIDRWILCGHSLGGIVACDYLAGHAQDLDALVLLASYPTHDLSAFRGPVLTVVGTQDGVLRRDAYEDARPLLPEGARELSIDGGNHAGFGNYGDQKGDWMATISHDEQQELTAAAIDEVASQL